MSPPAADVAAHPSRPVSVATSPAHSVFLGLTAVLCGAVVMTLEVLGSRVIGPWFGVSLYVWTALIGVTLVALAAGYWAGGRLCDRVASGSALYALVAGAGVATLVIPLIRGAVLNASSLLGLRAGSLVAALLLFGVPLFLLGCVTPYVVRLLVQGLDRLGRTVGALYALSTLGSLGGTLLTGFVLVPAFSVDAVLAACGGLLLVLAAVWFGAFHRRWQAIGLLPVLALGWPGTGPVEAVTPDGTQVRAVLQRDTAYGRVQVIEYSHGATQTRELVIDGLVQGGIDRVSGLSVYEYPYLLRDVPRALNPGGRRCLVLGLGAGLVPAMYARLGVTAEAVDIDPVVAGIARREFALPGAVDVHIADARQFLSGPVGLYDYIIVDVFNGDVTPGHLLSVEALHLMRRHLAPRGVLALNVVLDLGGGSRATRAIGGTLHAVFDQVEAWPLFDAGSADPVGNVIIVAYDGERRAVDPRRIGAGNIHPLAEPAVRAAASRSTPLAGRGTPVLTDAYNPIDLYDLDVRERVRRNILDTTPRAVLAGGR